MPPFADKLWICISACSASEFNLFFYICFIWIYCVPEFCLHLCRSNFFRLFCSVNCPKIIYNLPSFLYWAVYTLRIFFVRPAVKENFSCRLIRFNSPFCPIAFLYWKNFEFSAKRSITPSVVVKQLH